jgi:hypothetical protein
VTCVSPSPPRIDWIHQETSIGGEARDDGYSTIRLVSFRDVTPRYVRSLAFPTRMRPRVWSLLEFGMYVLVSLPFLCLLVVMVGVVIGSLSHWRSIRFASKASCRRCGAMFGRAAVLAGEDRYSQKIKELRQQHPDAMFRMDPPEWVIECPNCSLKVYFRPLTHQISESSAFERADPQPQSSPI